MRSYPSVAELAARLGEHAEAVCRHYLSNGRREGHYWRVGDVFNTAGSSLYVKLTGPLTGKGRRGKWTDAATGEHGDMLDLIRLSRGRDDWRETLDEARAFLCLPRPVAPEPETRTESERQESARRLFRMGRDLPWTLAAIYLSGRGIEHGFRARALRYHPNCYYRRDDHTLEEHPALLAAVTDLSGTITAVARTWLTRDGSGKAALPEPRKSMGWQLGHGVRFRGSVPDTLVAGEGLESVLSVQGRLRAFPAVAGLSANHLAALDLPEGLRRLYVARDNDAAGLRAFERLRARAEAAGVAEVWELVPGADDFNTDLTMRGPQGLAQLLAPQLAEEDAVRFLDFGDGETAAA